MRRAHRRTDCANGAWHARAVVGVWRGKFASLYSKWGSRYVLRVEMSRVQMLAAMAGADESAQNWMVVTVCPHCDQPLAVDVSIRMAPPPRAVVEALPVRRAPSSAWSPTPPSSPPPTVRRSPPRRRQSTEASAQDVRGDVAAAPSQGQRGVPAESIDAAGSGGVTLAGSPHIVGVVPSVAGFEASRGREVGGGHQRRDRSRTPSKS